MLKRSADELIVLGICLISLSGLIPFIIVRIMRGDWLVAAIDCIGAVCCVICIRRIWLTGSIAFIGPFIAVLAMAGMSANIVLLGLQDLYFLYPVVVLAFFLMAPLHALLVGSIASCFVAFYIHPELPTFETLKFLFSILGTAFLSFTFAWQRNRQRDLLEQQSRLDPLTGAGNRRALHEQLEELISIHDRDKQPMSLIILDLDDFKDINDQHGHLIGDAVLKRLTKIITQRIRTTDHLYRYGGDEFMILANHSDAETTRILAEDIRSLVNEDKTLADTSLGVSIGISEYRPSEKADDWLHRADSAMYSVKRNGKNAVHLSMPSLGT
jgi:diguanylate cyclase (GGDEF)-like protein